MSAVRLAGIPLRGSRHVCGFFRSVDEQYDMLLPFIKEGLEGGDYVHHLIDPARRADHMRRLQDFGIDAAVAEQRGQLAVQGWPDFFLHHGRVDPGYVLASLYAVLGAGRAKGFRFTRLVGNMEWTLENWPGADRFVEIEAQVNDLPLGDADAIVCTYELTRFGGAIMMDALRIHPTVMVGAIIIENPFFVPPARFLEELRGRSTPAVIQ